MNAHPILAGLNPPQREAVSAGAGPLMILAGAGSGKTRVLTRRLAWLIAEGLCAPEEILAVTFTNKAARQMRERVGELLDGMDPARLSRLWIGTFHGMGARILRRHGQHLGFDPRFAILDAADQQRLIKGLTESQGFKSSYWTPKRLAGLFSRWKDDGLSPDQIGEEHLPNPRDRDAVASFFQRYQEALLRANAMDFGDLLLNCLRLWRLQPEILDQLQRRFRHLLVDEYQDTNLVQYHWIQQLAGARQNLSVVGDDDQAIYSWRGARLDNILRFSEDFPNTTIIRLEQNYRSTGHILRAAGELISNNQGRMDKTLWTDGIQGTPVERYAAEDDRDEAQFIADEIKDFGGPGRGLGAGSDDFSRFAILVRTARQTRAVEDALMRRGIPYQIVGGLRFMDRAEVKDALAYLRLAQSDRDDVAFERIVNVPARGVGAAAVARIREAAGQLALPLFGAAERLLREKAFKGRAAGSLTRFVEMIREAAGLIEQRPPEEALAYLLSQSGYLQSLDGDERRADKLENLQELNNELGRRGDLARFLEEAALVSDLIAGEENSGADAQGRVLISTLHAAKGLEFPVVFLAGLEEELLPHKLALDLDDGGGLEEERRLAYVGMTRAREKLYLTHARSRWLFNRRVPALPSRFLNELPEEAITDRSPKFAVRRGVGGARRGRPGRWG